MNSRCESPSRPQSLYTICDPSGDQRAAPALPPPSVARTRSAPSPRSTGRSRAGRLGGRAGWRPAPLAAGTGAGRCQRHGRPPVAVGRPASASSTRGPRPPPPGRGWFASQGARLGCSRPCARWSREMRQITVRDDEPRSAGAAADRRRADGQARAVGREHRVTINAGRRRSCVRARRRSQAGCRPRRAHEHAVRGDPNGGGTRPARARDEHADREGHDERRSAEPRHGTRGAVTAGWRYQPWGSTFRRRSTTGAAVYGRRPP